MLLLSKPHQVSPFPHSNIPHIIPRRSPPPMATTPLSYFSKYTALPHYTLSPSHDLVMIPQPTRSNEVQDKSHLVHPCDSRPCVKARVHDSTLCVFAGVGRRGAEGSAGCREERTHADMCDVSCESVNVYMGSLSVERGGK